VYRPASLPDVVPPPAERLRSLIMVYARIFAPSPEKSLQSVIARHRDLGNTRTVLSTMIRDGDLRKEVVDGVAYVWPNDAIEDDVPRQVRFLAPFDPVVWDRARFEHLWGWAYRFEAYTPIKKRVRGYYAMPMLWRSDLIGWANASAMDAMGATGARGAVDVKVGYVNTRPRDSEFRRELDAEIARLSEFLQRPA
jgi:uncharacterized protein YcaQ